MKHHRLAAILGGLAAALLLAITPVLAATITYSVASNGVTYGSVTVSSPDTYGYGLPGAPACPTTTTTDSVTVSWSDPTEIVQGQIVTYWAIPGGPSYFETVPVQPSGPGTYTYQINYPPSSQWLSDDIHTDVQLASFATNGGYLLASLGGQNLWDVFGPCAPPQVALGPGSTGTIGFWHNKNGQYLIDSFNGGSSSTALGNWLASTFPNLYGCLAGQTNAQIAALFAQDFSVKGPKPDAQVLATALSVYATSTNLSGTSLAAKYGFAVTANGVGSLTYNVGNYGAAVGAPNNTTMSILQILQGASAESSNCVLDGGSSTLLNLTNSLFSAINQVGDITG